ncbi:MAG: esterase family protein [Candidatus Marinimicrobia bacterium]|nr:esterase family protein [Candidatus Neomarinimicrobiota bacterium]
MTRTITGVLIFTLLMGCWPGSSRLIITGLVKSQPCGAGDSKLVWPEKPGAASYTFSLTSELLDEIVFDTVVATNSLPLAVTPLYTLLEQHHLRRLMGRWSVFANGDTIVNAQVIRLERPICIEDYRNPFRELVKAVQGTSDPAAQQLLVDDFLATDPPAPFTDDAGSDTLDAYAAFYLFQDSSRVPPILSGSAYGWGTDEGLAPRLNRLGQTTLYYYETTYELSARLEYKYIIENEEWILDPRNPAHSTGGFGFNSELRMPGYAAPPEIAPADSAHRGRLTQFSLDSRIYNNRRTISVYLPLGYSEDDAAYPVFWFLDGQDFLNFAQPGNILDNTIGQGKCRPLVAVFIPNVEREREYYANNDEFRRFLLEEVRPVIIDSFNVATDREMNAVGGVSWSAQASLEIATNLPDIFGKAMCMSTAGRPPDWYPDPGMPLQLYFDWGTYEALGNSQHMRRYGAYFGASHEVWERSFFEGHNWSNWRGHIDDVLSWFFPTD